ncbi:MAG: hypothetical protein M1817_006235 [Caeruleum heppii]|nr:MAG: hypothetical protein M1817_006235 [Caeruleum heppii]
MATHPFRLPFQDTRPRFECLYPIDGQYGRLPRFLFYGLIILSPMVRKHEWIVAGALTAATTYAGAAAVHAISLIVTQATIAEYDIPVLKLIVGSGSLAAAPLLQWSSTVRRFNIKSILLCWNFLLLIAYFILVLGATPSIPPFAIECDALSGKTLETTISAGLLSHYGCQNPCEDPRTRVIFRPPSTAVITPATYPKPRGVHGDELTDGLTTVLYFAEMVTLLFLPFQWFYLCLSGSQSTRDVRNSLFRRIASTKRVARGGHVRRLSIGTGLLVAGLLWLTAIVSVVVIPMLFVFNIVFKEINLHQYPVNEPTYAVGQWSPPLSVGLAILGALLLRYQRQLRSFVRLIVQVLCAPFKLCQSVWRTTPRRPPQNIALAESRPKTFAFAGSWPVAPGAAGTGTLSVSVDAVQVSGRQKEPVSHEPSRSEPGSRNAWMLDLPKRAQQRLVRECKDFAMFFSDPIRTTNPGSGKGGVTMPLLPLVRVGMERTRRHSF